MSQGSRQKTKIGGKMETRFIGLTAIVHNVVEKLHGIDGIAVGRVRAAHGQQKVKIPARWPERRVLPIIVSDKDNGEREIIIRALKAGAVARIIRSQLLAKGISVIEYSAS